jgi:uncharacterized protein YifE (UPF0438 family)
MKNIGKTTLLGIRSESPTTSNALCFKKKKKLDSYERTDNSNGEHHFLEICANKRNKQHKWTLFKYYKLCSSYQIFF